MQRAAEAPWRCLQKRWRRHATARAALSGCRFIPPASRTHSESLTELPRTQPVQRPQLLIDKPFDHHFHTMRRTFLLTRAKAS
jgi:hypothetical protein